MRIPSRLRCIGAAVIAALAPFVEAPPAAGQIQDVSVGVTPSCPYGISACWGGAFDALKRLDNIAWVSSAPDPYNCTAQVRLKESKQPDPTHWAEQFQAVVGENHRFRGVEITIRGTVHKRKDNLVLESPGMPPLPLVPLEHKLQWNFRKAAPRQPEPDEQAAHKQLTKLVRKNGETTTVEVTGPLRPTEQGLALEVREFFQQAPDAPSDAQAREKTASKP